MTAIPQGLPTIGPATLTLLRSRSVSTALDIFDRGGEGYKDIPGLGPAKWAVLEDWMWKGLSFDDRILILQRLRERAASGVSGAWVVSDKLGCRDGRRPYDPEAIVADLPADQRETAGAVLSAIRAEAVERERQSEIDAAARERAREQRRAEHNAELRELEAQEKARRMTIRLFKAGAVICLAVLGLWFYWLR